MFLINKVIPAHDQTWTQDQIAEFTKQTGDGYNYMTVLRPFGSSLWVDDVHRELTDYYERSYFLLGN